MKLSRDQMTSIVDLYQRKDYENGSRMLCAALQSQLTNFFQFKLMGYADSKHHSEDLAQDTLVKLHRALCSNARHTDPIRSLNSFTHTCARRVLADWWEAQPIEIMVQQTAIDPDGNSISVEMPIPPLFPSWPDDDDDPTRPADPYVVLESRQRRLAFEACLERLPNEKYRRCLVDWLSGIPLKELAVRYRLRDTNGAAAVKNAASKLVIKCLVDMGFDVAWKDD